jgi:uncharacterized membrane protein YhfC
MFLILMSSTLTVSSFVNHAFAAMLILLLLFLGDLDFLKKRLHVSFTYKSLFHLSYFLFIFVYGFRFNMRVFIGSFVCFVSDGSPNFSSFL